VKSRVNVVSIKICARISGGSSQLNVKIHPGCTNMAGTQIVVKSLEEYHAFLHHRRLFENLLLNDPENWSYLGPGVWDVLHSYHVEPQTGIFAHRDAENVKGERFGIDGVKMHSACAHALAYLPVLSPFNVWERYDGHEIAENEWYLIRFTTVTPPFSRDVNIFPYEALRYILQWPRAARFTISHYLRVTLRPNKVRDAIGAMFIDRDGTTLSLELAKMITNVGIGKTGKLRHTYKAWAPPFTNDKDARIFHHLQKEFYRGTNIEVWTTAMAKRDLQLWLVGTEQTVDMDGTLTPINYAIKAMAAARMFDMIQRCKEEGVTPYAIRSDCVYCVGEPDAIANLGLKEGHEAPFGGFKLLPCKTFDGDNVLPFKICPEVHPVARKQPVELQLVEETEEHIQAALTKAAGNVLILGTAGAGKTRAAMTHALSSFDVADVLVACPYHSHNRSVAHDYGVECLTYHKLLGLNGEMRATHKMALPPSTRCIVFEELLLVDSRIYIHLFNMVRKRPEIRFLATTDGDQLPAINDPVNTEDKLKMLEVIFPHHVMRLTINRRICVEDEARMKEIIQDLRSSRTIQDVVRKWFPNQLVKLDNLTTKGIRTALA
jgi:hypothetical protein